MKHENKLKRATALLLALALAWSGSLPDSGLSLVRATEATDAAVDDVDSTEETTADATVEEDSKDNSKKESKSDDESTEDQKEPTDEETEENNVDEDVVDSDEESEEELLEEELEDETLLKEEEEKEKTKLKLIADFDFEGLSAGDTMTGADAKASGSYSLTTSYDGSQALSLNGSNQYLKVTTKDGDSLLGGYDSVSISADVQFLRTEANWLFYSAPDSNAQSFPNEHYIGAFLESGRDFKAEQYHNFGSRPGCATTSLSLNSWNHIEAVYSKDVTTIYIDGEKKATFESGIALEDILKDSPITLIGRANWGNGEYCKAYVDNFKIYSGSLSDGDVKDLYQAYLDRKVGEKTEVEFSLNAGYVTRDINLPAQYDGKEITWESSDEDAITVEGKVTRSNKNKEVTLTATIDGDKKDFNVVVLKEGKEVITYTNSKPAVGQDGGMMIAAEKDSGFTALHKNQPILYTALGNKSYSSPVIVREEDGEGFFMVATSAGKLLTYKSEDLTTYTDENEVALGNVSTVRKAAAVYDMTDERYEIYLKTDDGLYLVTSKDMKKFDTPLLINDDAFDFETVKNSPSTAISPSVIGLTNDEYERVVEKFTNPYNTELTDIPTDEIKVDALTTTEEFKEILAKYIKKNTLKAKYSDGTKNTYSLRFTEESIDNVDLELPGTYTLEGVIGGSGNFTNAADPLVPERADPYVVYNEDDGYYYFTASYPMIGSGDKDGYDRVILRRAKTIEGLATAEEVSIWDENTSKELGRFIWAPEMHKIGDSWYLVATAGLNTGSGTTFNIRPFMIKFEGNAKKDALYDLDKWGDPVLVKPVKGDNILNAMSLDMTYFEAGGQHYLIWADETRNSQNPDGLSYLFIATIDPENPTQLTSKAQLLTKPEFNWELVRYKVNEGPGVFHKDGKVYMTFSASGTGSEYCVGLMYADEKADLTDISNWTKLPYPILTSSDFDDEVSGPGHNSFTYDENGNLVIVYHARESKSHATHSGDPLYDPCRNAYVKTVLFDEDGLPIFNLSSEDFIKGGDTFKVNVVVEGEEIKAEPVLEYDFNGNLKKGVVKDVSGNGNDGYAFKGELVSDKDYGKVLYLSGDDSVGGNNSYLEFPKGFFDGRNKMTISFDVKEVTRTGNYFTFTFGQDNSKYLFYKAMPTAEKLAITKNGGGAESKVEASATYPNTASTWINITVVVDGTKMSLYRDGKLIGTNKNTGVKVSDLGEDLLGYLGKSFYSADDYFRGYFDNVKVYDRAYKKDDVARLYTAGRIARAEEVGDVNYVANNYVIPNMNKIKGNITLLSEVNGVDISWTSSNENVISTQTKSNAGYDSTPAGVVTRQDKNVDVTLTATFTKGDKSVTKTFECKVLKAPKASDEYVGYLFVHFTGTEAAASDEQVYFSVSKDGFNWEDLNNNNPIITSTIGESGLRDMYIARTPEGDKFYMISTDLSIYHNKANAWGAAGSNGSHSIVVWESSDLVHWSKPWLAEIAPKNAGCTWAPEFVYDDVTGEYVVYWSATTLEVDENEKITQDYENHAIYYAKTRDFVHFTEPKLYHEGGRNSNGVIIKVIDSTMIKGNDGKYYRYTKNESNGSIKIDVADNVLGSFEDIDSKFLDETLPRKVGSVEGPIIFKLNEKNDAGEDQWCLLIDRFARGQGYYPVVTTDLASGDFQFVDDSKLGSYNKIKYRHGYVMPITAEEYEGLTGRDWEKEDDGSEVIDTSKAQKTTRLYTVGETVKTDDIRIRATLENGKKVTIKDNLNIVVPEDITAETGRKTITVSYEYLGKKYDAEVTINVVDKDYRK